MSDKTYDFTMNTNMHAAFLREIDRLRTAVRTINWSDPAAVAGLRRRYEFFSGTLRNHHEGEDQFLWPAVEQRGTPEEKVVMAAMEAEHSALAESLGRLDADLPGFGPDSDPVELTAHLDELQAVLKGHCAHEERDGIPLVVKYLTPQDMKGFMAYIRSAPDSSLVLPWACDGATQQQVESTWSMLPGFVRLFVKPMTTRKYVKFTQTCGV